MEFIQNKLSEIVKKSQELKFKMQTVGKFKGYSIKNNMIIKIIGEQELYYIDGELAWEIIADIHVRYGHIGIRKTWMIFRENYFSKHDLTIIKDFCKTCKICNLGKYKNFHNRNTVESIRVTRPLEIIAIDYLNNLITTRN